MKSYDSRTIDDRVISEFEDQMFVLFGKKETEVIMNNFLREKQVPLFLTLDIPAREKRTPAYQQETWRNE
jgi:hypothetical protein